jgi:hypothetical protein
MMAVTDGGVMRYFLYWNETATCHVLLQAIEGGFLAVVIRIRCLSYDAAGCISESVIRQAQL